MSTTIDELPEYAAIVADCGDPQPTIDELTADLDAQTPPVIAPEPGAEDSEEFAAGENGDRDA